MIPSSCVFKPGDSVNLLAEYIGSTKDLDIAKVHFDKKFRGAGYLLEVDKNLCEISRNEIKIKSSIVPIQDIQKWIPNGDCMSAEKMESLGVVGVSVNRDNPEKEKVFIVNQSCVSKI